MNYSSGKDLCRIYHTPRTAMGISDPVAVLITPVNAYLVCNLFVANSKNVENYFSKAIAETEVLIELQKDPRKASSSPVVLSKYMFEPSPRATSSLASASPGTPLVSPPIETKATLDASGWVFKIESVTASNQLTKVGFESSEDRLKGGASSIGAPV
jgi:hypothetical protein